MNVRKFTLLVVALSMSAGAFAQKVKLREGSLDAIKEVKKFNVQYQYDGMTVTTKNKPEDEFIKEKKKEYNEKESGKGNTWAAAWVTDRKQKFEPEFKEQFDKQSGAVVGDFPTEKYTLIFKTTHTETGFNVGVMKRPAFIDGELLVVETANPSQVIARLSVDDCPGRMYGGFDYATGDRLKESYAVAGKGIGKFFRKKL